MFIISISVLKSNARLQGRVFVSAKKIAGDEDEWCLDDGLSILLYFQQRLRSISMSCNGIYYSKGPFADQRPPTHASTCSRCARWLRGTAFVLTRLNGTFAFL